MIKKRKRKSKVETKPPACFCPFYKILFSILLFIELVEHRNNDCVCLSIICLLIRGLTIKSLLNWIENGARTEQSYQVLKWHLNLPPLQIWTQISPLCHVPDFGFLVLEHSDNWLQNKLIGFWTVQPLEHWMTVR